jgi:hypothetical protein
VRFGAVYGDAATEYKCAYSTVITGPPRSGGPGDRDQDGSAVPT